MPRNVQRLYRNTRGLGRKTVDTEDRNVQKREAVRCTMGIGDVLGGATKKSSEETEHRAACGWV